MRASGGADRPERAALFFHPKPGNVLSGLKVAAHHPGFSA